MRRWLAHRKFVKRAMDIEEQQLLGFGDPDLSLEDSEFSSDWSDMQSAMNVLKESAIDVPIDTERFDHRLVRRWNVARVKRSFAYWSPAFFGAAIASVAFLALLQMLLSSSSLKPIRALDSKDTARNSADTVIISDMERSTTVRLK